MKKPDLDFPKFTKNEKIVLKKIIEQSRIPDLEIAKKMGLSQQAIFKIRHKLESLGVIKGYMPIIDYKKIGVETLVVVSLKLTPARPPARPQAEDAATSNPSVRTAARPQPWTPQAPAQALHVPTGSSQALHPPRPENARHQQVSVSRPYRPPRAGQRAPAYLRAALHLRQLREQRRLRHTRSSPAPRTIHATTDEERATSLTNVSYIWEKYSEEEISERIRRIPQVITAYRIPESSISHLLVMGFKSVDDKDRYLMKLQNKYSKEVEIVHVYPFSVDRIIKTSHIGLLDSIISEKEDRSTTFFIDK
jgi:DNA-binding Lrp family transcriptional regulator